MTKIKQTLLVILCVFASVSFCACKTDPSLKTAQYKGSITVGYYSGSYLNEPVVNIIRAVAGKMELKVYVKTETEQTWQADLHNDEIDMMIDEYNDTDTLSDALFSAKVVFVKHKGVSLDKGGAIGVLDVGFIRDSAAAITDFHNAQYKYYAIPEMIVADFNSGYLDGIILNEVDYLTYSTVEDVDYNVINTRDVHLIFEQGDTSLLEEFNKMLNQLKTDGTIQGLIYSD